MYSFFIKKITDRLAFFSVMMFSVMIASSAFLVAYSFNPNVAFAQDTGLDGFEEAKKEADERAVSRNSVISDEEADEKEADERAVSRNSVISDEEADERAVNTNFVSLSKVPGLAPTSATNISGALNTLYILLIGVGSLLAVIKISLAGVKYSMSEIITDKSDAKKDIMGALLGLALLLIPFVVLTTINPTLVDMNILKSLGPIDPPPKIPKVGSTATTPGTSQTIPGTASKETIADQRESCGKNGGGSSISTVNRDTTLKCNKTQATLLKEIADTTFIPGETEINIDGIPGTQKTKIEIDFREKCEEADGFRKQEGNLLTCIKFK